MGRSKHKNRPDSGMNFSTSQITIMVVLRLAIGWHFLYEGVSKILNPNWTSAGFLLDSKGILQGFFHSLAMNKNILEVVDFLNVWGLTAIGFGLVAGLFIPVATLAGMIILGFYYLSHPPLIGADYAIPSEGSYLIVNKNLIEFFALWTLYLFPCGNRIGLDRFIFSKK